MNDLPFDFDTDADNDVRSVGDAAAENAAGAPADSADAAQEPAGTGADDGGQHTGARSTAGTFTEVEIDDIDGFSFGAAGADSSGFEELEKFDEPDGFGGSDQDDGASFAGGYADLQEEDGAGDQQDARNDYDIETVSVSGKAAEEKEQSARRKASGASSGRHAMTTSRGVVYVESYDDEEYEETSASGRRISGIIIAAVIVAALVAVGISLVNYCRRLVSSDTVYSGITVNGNPVGGLTREGLCDYINTTYSDPVAGSTVTVDLDGNVYNYPLQALLNLPDAESVADEIFGYARSGNLFSRALAVLRLRENGRDYPLDYTVNSATVDGIVLLSDSENQQKIEPTYVVEENRIVFTCGKNGGTVDAESVEASLREYIDGIIAKLDSGNTSDLNGVLTIVPKTVEFHKILKANILNELAGEAQDARIEKKSDTELRILAETQGYGYDEDELDFVLDRVNSGEEAEGTTLELEFYKKTIINTREFYERVLFRNKLAESSNINSAEDDPEKDDSEARDKNIALAAKALDGYILLPGEALNLLSVLDVNGEDSEYVPARENYSGFDKQVVGGGISQVATALYDAAFLADLEIVSRAQYTYAPNFGLLGFDAYVDAGSGRDLVILNSDPLPVRINVTYSAGRLTVTLTGTVFFESDFAGLEIDPEDIPYETATATVSRSLSVQIARSQKPSSDVLTDPLSPKGTQKVYQTGVTGYTLNLYIIENTISGQVRTFLGVGQYASRNEIVLEGTMEPSPTPDEPTATPDEPTVTPDDNTPAPPTPTDGGDPTDSQPTETPGPDDGDGPAPATPAPDGGSGGN